MEKGTGERAPAMEPERGHRGEIVGDGGVGNEAEEGTRDLESLEEERPGRRR